MSRPPALVLASAALVAAAALLPLGFVAGVTLRTPAALIAELLFRPRVGELLANTALLLALAVPLCIALAVALAWITERTTLPGRRLWSALATASLAVPAFVQGYAWTSVAPALNGPWAAVGLSVVAYFPFVFLPAAAAMRGLDPELENVAASLGDGRWRIFARVVLPQLRGAIGGGALLVSLHLLAEYGLFALIRFDTFTTAIVDQFQSTYNGPAANMMAGVLALACLALLAIEPSWRDRNRRARVGTGASRAPRRLALGPHAVLACTLLPAAVAAAAIGVPLATLARWTFAGGLAAWDLAAIGRALSQTLGLAAIGALLTVAAAFPTAWLSVRAPRVSTRVMEGAIYAAGSLPGVVVALGLVTVTVRNLPMVYQTVALLFAAYAILFLPRALISVRAGIAQVPVELERVAASLGTPPARTFVTVTLRLCAPMAAAGGALVFLGIATELTATLLLAPIGTRTLATQFWALTGEIDYVAAAPYAILMVVLSLPMTALLYTQSFRAAGR